MDVSFVIIDAVTTIAYLTMYVKTYCIFYIVYDFYRRWYRKSPQKLCSDFEFRENESGGAILCLGM